MHAWYARGEVSDRLFKFVFAYHNFHFFGISSEISTDDHRVNLDDTRPARIAQFNDELSRIALISWLFFSSIVATELD